MRGTVSWFLLISRIAIRSQRNKLVPVAIMMQVHDICESCASVLALRIREWVPACAALDNHKPNILPVPSLAPSFPPEHTTGQGHIQLVILPESLVKVGCDLFNRDIHSSSEQGEEGVMVTEDLN